MSRYGCTVNAGVQGNCRSSAGQCDWHKNGGEAQNRTVDTGIFSPLLYRLSYLATDLLSIGSQYFFVRRAPEFSAEKRLPPSGVAFENVTMLPPAGTIVIVYTV